ncbi:uncharacterized protein ColSpa_04597 [Colletotrichum spaethianum]|uniref:Uncharacterized protein n=1 Tax=Colletotrichum spaethianum TaxID=700344 RepID=A0AA37L9Q4_9PEZI|nr:uncharacterized protein ColSpa_04597 [Colletotrichum spaethianum]GKT44416.1 hypothetical protein ColSpa_04597 [Colletotrichum spaethianum]
MHVMQSSREWKQSWPKHIRWIWNKQVTANGEDPRRVVLVTTYNAWQARSAKEKSKDSLFNQ